jgi:ketosteroid isomerase-like protein
MAPLDVMRRYIDAARRGDWETGLGYLADDVVLRVPGRSALAGEHRGRDAVRGYIDAALGLSHGGRVEVELVDMLAGDERVALIVRERFHRHGGIVEIGRTNVYRVLDEKIVEVWIFEEDQYAVDELLADPSDTG